MEEGKINDIAGEEMVMKDMDYAKVKNKAVKPEKRVFGETVPELSSNEELRAQFSTVRCQILEVRKIVEKLSQPWRSNPAFFSGAESLQGCVEPDMSNFPILKTPRTLRVLDKTETI
jgi:hypothetical protein